MQPSRWRDYPIDSCPQSKATYHSFWLFTRPSRAFFLFLSFPRFPSFLSPEGDTYKHHVVYLLYDKCHDYPYTYWSTKRCPCMLYACWGCRLLGTLEDLWKVHANKLRSITSQQPAASGHEEMCWSLSSSNLAELRVILSKKHLGPALLRATKCATQEFGHIHKYLCIFSSPSWIHICICLLRRY